MPGRTSPGAHMDYVDAAAILRPRLAAALDAWRTLVEANEAQAERLQPGRAESDTWGEISGANTPANTTKPRRKMGITGQRFNFR